MNQLLIIKCGAAGDVVRTTTLLHPFTGWEIDWLVAKENRMLLPESRLRAIYDDPSQIPDTSYDLVINLEDDEAYVAQAMRHIRTKQLFGAYCAPGDGRLLYTDDSAAWFDMGLISRYGLERANQLKYQNHRSYQEIIFEGLGFCFRGEPYVMPERLPASSLEGDIAVAPTAGKRWPMKNWAHIDRLTAELSADYRVNVLPVRQTMLDHIADIRNHRFLIAPDSLPMHCAIGLGLPSLAIFPCTSPWEIYDYQLLTKIVSPKLEQYFFGKTFIEDAVTCIPYDVVRQRVETLLAERSISAAAVQPDERAAD
jgi:heptosyltransferase II